MALKKKIPVIFLPPTPFPTDFLKVEKLHGIL